MAYFVYSLNSSGIAAACAAAEAGADVFACEPGPHIGAMWASGLGQTDREAVFSGAPSVSLRWGLLDEFTRAFGSRTTATGAYLFPTMEVVLDVFTTKLNSYSVAKVVNGKRKGKITWRVNAPLESVTKNRKGDAIVSVTCGGTTYTCKNYSDCSDEGDLARMAGVTMRLGRESKAMTGEVTAGLRPQEVNSAKSYDPVTGERLPKLDARWRQTLGEADARIMAFNMRIIVTDVEGKLNWADLNVPGYNPRDHDLDYAIAKSRNMTKIPGSISNAAFKPTGTYPQYDMNNGGGLTIGSNWIGKMYDWHYMSFAERQAMKDAYILRTAGLFKAICSDPLWANGLPELVADTKLWGLVPGLFTDSIVPGMSPHVYVRESFRIVGQADMTFFDVIPPEKNIVEPITAYGYPHADTHLLQRGPSVAGRIAHEGNNTLDGGFEIVAVFLPWGCVKPLYGECKNLTVARVISGTRMGWINCRIEQSWMKIANAIGLAGALADSLDIYTGDLNYASQLKPVLLAAGAQLQLPAAA